MPKGNLLLVDDEPMLLTNLRISLEEYADEIYTATNGIEALQIIQEKTIHCIVCDINMPKMNGVEVIKELRSKGNNVPFIFFTGHGNRELMQEAVKYGAFDFLDKPHFDGLEEVIAKGMASGFKQNAVIEPDGNEILSEYQKMLRELDK